MRGQEYTVMNYLVWVVFAAAFLLVALQAYRVIASQGGSITEDAFRKMLEDVSRIKEGCVSTNGPIVFVSGFTIDEGYISRYFSGDVYVCAPRGVSFSNESGGVVATVSTEMRAVLAMCKTSSRLWICINDPVSCASPSSFSTSRCKQLG